MKRTSTVLAAAAAVALAWPGAMAWGQAKTASAKETIFASADKAQFKEVAKGVSKAVLWGDHDKGPYGAFTKFAPGFDGGQHTHTNDVWIVVVRGAYRYRDEAGEKRVGPGDFIRIPGGKRHWSGGDPAQGALFYEESSGRFDLVPAK